MILWTSRVIAKHTEQPEWNLSVIASVWSVITSLYLCRVLHIKRSGFGLSDFVDLTYSGPTRER
jgi:hypothetical protein